MCLLYFYAYVVVVTVQFYGVLDHSSQKSYFVVLVNTIDREVFAVKIFRQFSIRLVLFLALAMTTRPNQLTPFTCIRPRNYFACLIFVVKGDRQKFFQEEISQSTVGTCVCVDAIFVSICGLLHVGCLHFHLKYVPCLRLFSSLVIRFKNSVRFLTY